MHIAGPGVFILYLDTKRKVDAMSKTVKLDKKGMEMWQLVMIILVLILLLAVLVWYGFLGGEIKGVLGKLGDLL